MANLILNLLKKNWGKLWNNIKIFKFISHKDLSVEMPMVRLIISYEEEVIIRHHLLELHFLQVKFRYGLILMACIIMTQEW